MLVSVPGLDEALVERILAARSMGGTQNGSRMHPVWLLSEGLVDVNQMRVLLPHLSAGGHVFRAEFLGRVSGQSAVYRCEAIVDAASQRPRQIFFRELPPLPQHDSLAVNPADPRERSTP